MPIPRSLRRSPVVPSPGGEGPAASGRSLGEWPLSYGQRALWFLCRLAPESTAYHIAAAARVLSPLDIAALRRSFAGLVARHAALRTTFAPTEQGPVQRIHATMEADFLAVDAREESEKEVAARLEAAASLPFDLESGPLLRVRVLARSTGEHVVLLVLHHLVADLWSIALLLDELAAVYAQEAGGPAAGPPLPEITYIDYVDWQEQQLAGPEGERLWAYWRERLAGDPPPLELPCDRARPPVRTDRGGARSLTVDSGLARAVRAAGRRGGATLQAFLTAAFEALLHRYSDEEDFCVGSPAAGRVHPQLAGLVGYFVNPLPLRADLSGQPTFTALLARVRETVVGAFAHQAYPFPLLVERLQPRRDPSRSPLFDTLFVFQKVPFAGKGGLGGFALGQEGARAQAGPLELKSLALARRTAQFDLTLMVAEVEGELRIGLEYNADLFDGTTAERLLTHFRALLAAAAADPARQVAELPLLSEPERALLLREWSGRGAEAVPDLCLHELFAAQAARTPDAAAVVCEHEAWTYRELDRRSEELAGRLCRLGVGPEVLVGVLLPRSLEMVAALLGVLKAGGAYVALDPAYPAARTGEMLRLSGDPIVLTARELAPGVAVPESRLLLVDAPADSPGLATETAARDQAGPRNLAYVLFTSGSTGQPKGVAVEHRSAAALVRWARQTFSDRELAGVLAATSIGFDLSVFELFVPLALGGRAILAPDPLALPSLPAASEVALVNTVPSALSALLAAGGLPKSVRTVNLAGEALPGPLVEEIFARSAPCRVLNLYGPSEDTTYSTFADLKAGGARVPPIGRPLADKDVYILDAAFEPVPPGAPGELYLGGAGLARGYLCRPDLTAERFLPHPFGDAPGARLYRTGDRVRFRRTGELEFLGRLDDQVKLRGFRIEPGEIAAALGRHPQVAEAAVAALPDGTGEIRLVACFVPREGAAPAAGELRRWLAGRLPAYMVPAAFVPLPSLPRTPSGKVDRHRLPFPAELLRPAAGSPPRTPAEELVAGLWCELLGIEQVGTEDDFFEIGGHSLLAAQLVARLRRTLGVEVTVREVFERRTVAGLAAMLAGSRGPEPPVVPVVPIPRDGLLPLSFAQQRLWFLAQLEPESPAYHLPAAVRLRGPIDRRALAQALAEIVRRHEALRTTFAAPGGRPGQTVTAAAGLELPLLDLGGLPSGVREPASRDLAGREARRPFDLSRGPLLRARLVALGPQDHLLLITLHHIAADGWSLGILARELGALYGAFHAGRPSPLHDLSLQVADLAYWQRQLGGEALEDRRRSWRERLAGAPRALALPADRPRPARPRRRGAVLPWRLPEERTADLETLGRSRGATLFMTLLGALTVLLGRWSGEDDLLVGAPVAGRDREEAEPLIGCFVNLLVLRLKPGGDVGEGGFAALLAAVRAEVLDAFARQEIPFETLVEELAVERSPGLPPLVQVALAFGPPLPALALPGLAAEIAEVGTGAAKFDLALSLAPSGGGLAGSLEYNADLFDRTTVLRLLGHLDTLLASAVSQPDLRLGSLPLLMPPERAQLLWEWSGTPAGSAPAGLCVHELVAAQAARNPEALAVVAGDERLSYGDLERRAERLAAALRRLGVGPEVPVGLLAGRSPAMVVGALGILKTGGAYVPLDPDHPRERLVQTLAQAHAAVAEPVLVAEERFARKLGAGLGRRILLTSAGEGPPAEGGPPARRTVPENLAYVIFTSGSTGVPKGVAVSHASLVNLVEWHARTYRLDAGDRVTFVASPAFDAAVWEVWPCLCRGAGLWIPDGETRSDPERLLTWLAAEGIALCFLPTPLAEEVLRREQPPGLSLRALLTGGDRLHAGRCAPLPFPLVNHYGPTEGTVVATCARVDAAGEMREPPIGRPIANVRAYLLDRDFEPVLLGAAGEIVLGGAGLARGYLGRSDLTGERFVPDPLGETPGARLYRTGDLARHRSDGEIQFLGRLDSQIKVRGFRIEPGEVEAALAAHPAVAAAAVVAREEEGKSRLVAFTVSREGVELDVSELRRALAERLPEPMVPSVIAVLSALPLTPTGKIDRRALAALQAPQAASRPTAPLAFDPVEELVAGVWAELLGSSPASPGDSFFALGGHSLLAAGAVTRLREIFAIELPVGALFESPTVAGLAQRIEAARREAPGPETPPPLVPVEREGEIPLSFAQERLWLLGRLDPGGAAYHIAAAVRLAGPLAPPVLEQALAEVVRRHEALRTTFAESGGRPWQTISEAVPFRLPRIDLSDLPLAAREAAAESLATAFARLPFDLAAGPLVRACLLRLDPGEHRLLMTLHHAVADGWSMGILLRELAALYTVFRAGEPTPLPELSLQYADFAAWQRRWLQGEVLELHRRYWRQRLAGASRALDLPSDRPRPARRSQRGFRRSAALPTGLAETLEALSRREGATLFMALLAAFSALLARLADREDLLIGTFAAGREQPETAGLIGCFVNTLVLRLAPDLDVGLAAQLPAVRETVLGAFAHQDLPFERLVKDLEPERSLAHTPLFQVAFVLQNAPMPPLRLADLELEPLEVDAGAARYDLTLAMTPVDGGLAASLEASTDLFDPPTALRLAEHFAVLLAAAAADPQAPLGLLPLLTPAGRAQVLVEWNATSSVFPRGASIHGLIAAQAARTPETTALRWGIERVTYRDLDGRANRLAHRLQSLGVGPEVPVGICLERSPALVMSLLAVLKTGGAYVPLDPGYPRERLAFMLADSGVRVVLVEEATAVALPAGQPVVRVDPREGIAGGGAPADGASPESLAYILYTSGSTGQPKGVEVRHGGVVAFFTAMDRAVGCGPGDRLLAATSVGFDISVLELLWPLARGAEVILAGEAASLPALAARWRPTLFQCTPSLARMLLATPDGQEPLRPLRALLLGGEALPSALAARLRALVPARLVNLYGPTETTVWSTCWEVEAAKPAADGATVPIGHPTAGTRAVLLDRRLEPVPPGVPGRLFLGGEGLARGYRGRPDLTASRFLPDPFAGEAGARMYDTGDLARQRPEGMLEFLGRADNQIKVRGVRIEPAEIEQALAAHPAVSAAAVAARPEPEGGARLIACVVSAGPQPRDLGAFLRARLPEAMVPSAFVFLEALPLTPNGKLDRAALAGLAPAPAEAEGEPSAPRTPVEEVVAALFGSVLDVERAGHGDSFFALGGHSLSAVQLLSRVRDTFQVEMPLAALFEDPTVAGLAARVEAARTAGTEPLPLAPVLRSGELPLSFAQERLWFLHQLAPASPVFNVPMAVRLRGELRPAALERVFAEIVRRHEALRTRFPAAGGRPVQAIAPAAGAPWAEVDLASLPPAARAAEAERLAAAEARRPFDLERGPVVRATLVRCDAGDHLLLATLHHIVSDGWSIQVLFRELEALYAAFSCGEPSPLTELRLQYADFACHQRDWLQGEVLAPLLAYWQGQLAGLTPAELPPDRPRPTVRTSRGAKLPLRLPVSLTGAIRKAAAREGATPFMALAAAFLVLLQRATGRDDVAVGTPVAQRDRSELEGLIGLLINVLVLRGDLSGEPSAGELLQRVRSTCLEAYAHRHLPFEKVVEALQPERDLGRSPLFSAMLVLQAPPFLPTLPGAELTWLDIDSGTAQLDLTVSLTEGTGGLAGFIEYNPDLFDRTTIGRLARHFTALLAGLAADPRTPIPDIPFLDEAERQQLAVEWNDTTRPIPGLLLHQLFAEQVRRTPGGTAVEFEDEALSYTELDRRSAALARRLRALGTGFEAPIGILLERGIEAVVAVLAVLRAGGAYLPLDPESPRARLALLLACAAAVVTRRSLLDRLPDTGARTLCLEDPPGDASPSGGSWPEPDPASLAYVIHTSGSTGEPKGVMVSHSAAVNLTLAFRELLELGPGRRLLTVAPLTFDASVGNLFPALASGATLVLHCGLLELSTADFEAFCRERRIDRLDVPTAFWNRWVDDCVAHGGSTIETSVELSVVGGESISLDRLRAWERLTGGTRIFGPYGLTEATVCTTGWKTGGAPPPAACLRLPIGRPLANARVHVVDRGLRPAAAGVPGELVIAGAGLARGYLDRPDLTAAAFVPDPFAAEPGGRLYRTGDLARRLADGSLEFLGRRDRQVKLRGFRIELDEVEAALARHPGVRQCAAVVREDRPGDRRLVAYLAGDPAGLAPEGLRAFLKEHLPDSMIPSVFLALDALPLTRHGKVDHRALPVLPAVGVAGGADPRNGRERLLAGIWAEVLGCERIGIDDNFFDLGGDSILSLQIVARAAEAGLRLAPRQIFQHQTVAELAAVAREATPAVEQGPSAGEVPLTPVQRWFFELDLVRRDHWNQSVLLALARPVEPTVLMRAVGHLLLHHDALRLRFAADGRGWRQHLAEPGGPVPFIQVDLAQLADPLAWLAAAAGEVHASLDLARGPLLRAALFDLGPGDPARLLLTAHHLVVDAISWRFLLSDLETACLQMERGRQVRLPPKTTSWKRWVEALAERAPASEARELAGWLDLSRSQIPPLPVDFPGGINTEASAERVEVSVPWPSAARRAGLREVLLAALSRAFESLTGERRLLVNVEGHGREEELAAGADLSRTVGWFTSAFPLLLEAAGILEDTRAAVEERLAHLPAGGAGFGLLRWGREAAALAALPRPEVGFNYLGQLDRALPAAALFTPAPEPCGPVRDPAGQRPFLLEIEARVDDGRLEVAWIYSRNLHRRATVASLADTFLAALRELIADREGPEATAYRPADFPDVALDETGLARVLGELGIE